MRAAALASAFALASIAATASAASPAPATTTLLYEEASAAGESMDAFVARISPRAMAITRERRISLCGVIGQAGQQYSIKLGTSGSWRRCDIDLSNVAAGYTSTRVTFHTLTDDEGAVRGFTAQDFARGPGYVAFGRHLRYQQGRTKDRLVSSP
ncbi:hypothetical protein [Stenotrophomonas maltophilia]|uniref:hypothetical protein n=1 Tax=Stenotrophomonas maltophilia TaxID=40324 RepID=UPI000B26C920|nr:hypothetical protein [Stenotrophomonas maltophilia]